MKRFWLLLLSLGLIAAFSTSAMAVDVKFSGEYYAAGIYMDKTSFQEDVGPSTAFYFQRLRLNTTFVVHPGLFLNVRADIMERAWGASRTAPGTAADTQSQGTTAENENIAFDMTNLTYISPIGVFTIGWQSESTWATVFGNSNTSAAKISYALPIGNFTFIGQIIKHAEFSKTAKYASNDADADYNAYYLMAIYKFKYGKVGIANFALFNHMRAQPGWGEYKDEIPLYLAPYMQAQFGPVAVQAELLYQNGKRKSDVSGVDDIDLRALAGWVDVVADFSMFYVGGSIAYVSGDDPDTDDEFEGGNATFSGLSGGRDWQPCLIMFNSDRDYWAGALAGHSSSTMGGALTNAWFGQLRAGVRPVDKLDIMASVSYAKADQKPTVSGWDSKEYGWEVDLTATYKITNNLSYMLGGGYMFTGDYWKGLDKDHEVEDNFMVINKLTLTF